MLSLRRGVLSIEAKFLEELRQSTSHLRTSVGLFKEMQDARCKPFEDEASVVVRQIQRQDSVRSGREGGHVERTKEVCLCWLLIFLCNNVQC